MKLVMIIGMVMVFALAACAPVQPQPATPENYTYVDINALIESENTTSAPTAAVVNVVNTTPSEPAVVEVVPIST